jgi:hypothetical protein
MGVSSHSSTDQLIGDASYGSILPLVPFLIVLLPMFRLASTERKAMAFLASQVFPAAG